MADRWDLPLAVLDINHEALTAAWQHQIRVKFSAPQNSGLVIINRFKRSYDIVNMVFQCNM